MRRTAPAFHLPVLAALALAFVPAAQAQTSLRLLDWNIHRDIGPNSPNTASQGALAEVVNFLAPDIWTINELGGNAGGFTSATGRTSLIAFVQAQLTIFGASPVEGRDFFVYVSALHDGFTTSAIVSRYPFLATQTFSDAEGAFSSLRGLALAYVDVPGSVDVGVFTTHLKAQNTTNDAERRQSEANADRTSITGWLLANPGAGAILAGDFNETEDADDADNWSAGAIGDPLPGSGQAYRPITTLKSAGFADPKPLSIRGDPDTISATNPNARFDYLLYTPSKLTFTGGQLFDTKQMTSGELTALNAANGTAFATGDSATASDHLPVFGTFTVVPEPASLALLLAGAGWLGLRRRRGA